MLSAMLVANAGPPDLLSSYGISRSLLSVLLFPYELVTLANVQALPARFCVASVAAALGKT